mmetsp:Transcript_11592/g.17617  ORF Transcript_11592/g.17617 Transcript_11592/m.17617 type:complete len:145 (+) Transcript_11592:25-459(+)|eukprot:CAMPEP_0185024068 /NCGR_PEP_ID=MMETSP1103-20130426/6978_1 /TAXON_ID=36769 /ORGANISM="Paraphysomonas bandaiensis, Strain Caron Lab Isolate" /LENGTH=144 /DNA_ID=CAMNT_0027556917 /DNA_START=25 /DNA_END=459 /DNA_ORIENTATION=+
MEWADYLARGVPKNAVIYHMTERQDFESQVSRDQVYFPPTYEQDGFVHATAEPSFLLGVGNLFYKDKVGDWICLEIDCQKLKSRVVYEPAAAVGSTQHKRLGDEKSDEPLFPHIYGGINADAVSRTYNIIRGIDGAFHAIDGLV